jgi:DNA-binding MltR family transcriptional regulator
MDERIAEAPAEIDPEIIDDFEEFVEQFSKESHRAIIILGGAKIDEQLQRLLSATFVESIGREDELLEGDSPLSSFSARIITCYRLGLINKDFFNMLHLLRKIRNDFAHKVKIRIDQPPNRDKVHSFIDVIKVTETFSDVKSVYFPDSDDLVTDFIISICVLVLLIEKKIQNAQRYNGFNALTLDIPKNDHGNL